jgi:branched-chain amino acid transport system substrate-binding protein
MPHRLSCLLKTYKSTGDTNVRNLLLLSAFVAVALTTQSAAHANKNYGPGVTDTEIKLGQTMPYSGPASALSNAGKAEVAYFAMINASGGVNGRKINLISLDDGYSPPKTVEQTRRLVESENVLALFSPLGTAPNSAIHKYVNAKKVPHLFIASNLMRWADPEHFPWTIQTLRPPFPLDAKIFADHILKTRPNAKIAVLYQNDDLGKDYLKGLKEALGDRAGKMIVAEASYELTDPTIDSQIVTLKGSGADTFADFTTPKFGAQAIRRAFDIGWKPLHVIAFPSSSVDAALRPAGLEKAVGLISTAVAKDPSDPQWREDAAVKDYLAWAKQWYRDGDPMAWDSVLGYSSAQLMVEVLKRCGDDLTRENLLRHATDIKDLQLPMMLPGIKINTSPKDYLPVEQAQLMRFDGERWVRFGEIVGRP